MATKGRLSRPPRPSLRLRARIEHQEARDLADSPELAYWRARTGPCALDAGQPVQAADWACQARSAFKSQAALSPFFEAPLLRLEQTLRLRSATS